MDKEGVTTNPESSGSDSSIDMPLDKAESQSAWSWETDPANPYLWPTWKKTLQITMCALVAFVASLGTSIISPATKQLMDEFSVSSTVALLPLSLYVLALALGPIVGGPLSETVGRMPVFYVSVPLAALFSVGAALAPDMATLCVLRFLAGFSFAPSLAVPAGIINEMYHPLDRSLPSNIFILSPFLGPGVGPVIGSFIVSRLGWRWTQWTLAILAGASMITVLIASETYHPVLLRRRQRAAAKSTSSNDIAAATNTMTTTAPPQERPRQPLSARLVGFVTVGLARPLRMMFTEPVVGYICLYVAVEFATLFSFFAAIPYVFRVTYGFGLEHTGLVFVSVAVGCFLGALTIAACNTLLYVPRARAAAAAVDGQEEGVKEDGGKQSEPAPELRLYPAMIGSVGLPVGLFWFAWTARSDVHWASPAVALVPFAWGNISIFISLLQYTVDAYQGSVVASAASANSLARYGLAAVFPLFAIQMYQRLGIQWASSLLAFMALALLPVPWVLFRWGKNIRARSSYPTASN